MAKRTHEDAELTKQAILDSAFRLFSRRGYEPGGLSIGILKTKDKFWWNCVKK